MSTQPLPRSAPPSGRALGVRAKILLVGAIVVMTIGTLLMTQLTKDTPVPVLWLWMFILGLGVGPTFSVFTIVIQNAVPFQKLGVVRRRELAARLVEAPTAG